jgi:sigma-B regulation protein RsbU (phosphoserine phosphatase)
MLKKKNITAELAVVERQIYNLTKLVGINSMINSTLDMGRLLTVIMETIKDMMETEASTLLLYDEKNNDLVFKVALGEAGKELAERYRVKLGQGIAGWVAETRKPIFINDAYGDRRFDPEFDKITGFVTKSIICTPLLFKGRLLGAIEAINPSNRPAFTDDDMKLFKMFGDQVALAVQNAIYFQNALEEERIKNEISSAQAIQEALIPDVDMRAGNVRIAAKSTPTREIGGEFHSLFRLDRNHIGIALADLHVKGIPGGLHASTVSGAIRALAKVKGKNPVEVVGLLHLIMEHDERPIRNASILYGVIDLADQKLRFLNAGTAYPILVRDRVARYLRFGKRSLSQDIKEATSVAVSLKPGDLFVIVSDGIIRVRNRMGKQLGLKSVMHFIERNFPETEDIIESIMGFAADFSGDVGIREDISVITLRVD